ncbi:hypothetical protein QBC37DRAFT_16667 [Rhypophila decipiens]|uniref:Uncharacterized protein n=1 Tax=Rhypophila decipiens TaxID=261697 RepID=A0AAN6YG72_9PEZI|nr:hypothetical protein QBC37DRAFT_16667 [Rhypophila decipiens]
MRNRALHGIICIRILIIARCLSVSLNTNNLAEKRLAAGVTVSNGVRHALEPSRRFSHTLIMNSRSSQLVFWDDKWLNEALFQLVEKVRRADGVYVRLVQVPSGSCTSRGVNTYVDVVRAADS